MRSLLPLATALCAAAMVAACSSSPSGADTSGADEPDAAVPRSTPEAGADAASGAADGGGDSGSAPDPQAIAAGSSLVTAQGCNTSACHTANLSGNVRQDSGDYSANLTPDPTTGIYGWTVTDLTGALQDGVDKTGKMLCASMPRFPQLRTTDIADIYAYLESIPAVTKARTSTVCSP